jgi:SAM-dependent methyltransferase
MNAAATYDPKYFEVLARVEDEHFWFRARNRMIGSLAGRIAAQVPAPRRILEVGCGNGNVLRWFRDACPGGLVVGLDLYPEGLAFAAQRAHCPLVAADIHHAPFTGSFGLIGMFDVLEHLDDDVAALAALGAMLAEGGRLMLTVPASRALWSYFDETAHHRRRYDAGGLRARIEEAGLRVEFLTPFMASIFPLVYAGRKLAGLRSRAAEETPHDLKIVPGVNAVLRFILEREADAVAAGRVLPFGSSLVAIAGKR